MEIALINGPNLNRLGKREPELYGEQSFVNFLAELRGTHPGVQLHFFESQHEGELVEAIQRLGDQCSGLIFNPAAFTHTSIACADAVKSLSIPVVEVHLSNIFRRESFRHHSYVSAGATGVISGLGLVGYELALQFLIKEIAAESPSD